MDEHKTEAQMAQILAEAHTRVAVGGRYRHYKGNFYTVESVALIEATMESAVVYRAEYMQGLVFIRPLSDWLATVETGGKTVPRFTPAEL